MLERKDVSTYEFVFPMHVREFKVVETVKRRDNMATTIFH